MAETFLEERRRRGSAKLGCTVIGEFLIGGDCTIGLGVISGFLGAGEDPALLYLDGGVDLRTPTGILDSMGVAHMIAEPGAAEELARVGPRFPLMADKRIFLFGTNRTRPRGRPSPGAGCPAGRRRGCAAGRGRLPGKRWTSWRDPPGGSVRGRLRRGRRRLRGPPLGRHAAAQLGLTFGEAIACLSAFAASPLFGGLVVTEFNPDHADEEGEVAAALAAGLASALGGTPPPDDRSLRMALEKVFGVRDTHTRADLDVRCAVPYAPQGVEGAFAKG